jgi:hypothetical protein
MPRDTWVVTYLVGIRSEDAIDAVAAKVSTALGVTLHIRDSAHWGDPYYSASPESEIKLTHNLDPMYREGDPSDERLFSASARHVAYLVWDTVDPHAAVAALKAGGLDAELVART